jgi:hypothetical protein
MLPTKQNSLNAYAWVRVLSGASALVECESLIVS